MSAFNDARCEHCGTKVSWVGEVTDQPPCPRCGRPPDPKALTHDQAEMARFREFLKARKKGESDAATTEE